MDNTIKVTRETLIDISDSLSEEWKKKISDFYKLTIKIGVLTQLKKNIHENDLFGPGDDSYSSLMSLFGGKPKVNVKDDTDKYQYKALSEIVIIDEWLDELNKEMEEFKNDKELNAIMFSISVLILGKATAESLIKKAYDKSDKENTNEESN